MCPPDHALLLHLVVQLQRVQVLPAVQRRLDCAHIQQGRQREVGRSVRGAGRWLQLT